MFDRIETVNLDTFCSGMLRPARSVRLILTLTLVWGGLQLWTPAAFAQVKKRVFVHADDSTHKQAIKAVIGQGGVRHDYISAGSEGIFSAELNRGQIRAVERLGGRVEPVPQVYPVTRRQHHGALGRKVTPQGKPVCGDGVCHKKEANNCPGDCGGPPPPDPPSGRECAPQDQREYQTLLPSGATAGATTGSGVKLLVIDTGVNKNHTDLDVSFCRNTTRRKIRNNCKDEIGHGTHVAGSAASNGGDDGLGLLGTAPGVTLGVTKICTTQCFLDDLIRGIEDGTSRFDPDIMSLSFSASDTSALRNAVNAAVSAGTLFLAAVGNDGPGANTISYPASYSNVVGVGSLDAAGIASRMSSRGIDDGNDNTVAEREMELTGGGFVIESTSAVGCYETLSGTSMATPSVAGFAAANWMGSNTATRDYLQSALVAEDVDNSVLLPGYDDTDAGFDTSTGYGLPRAQGTNGTIFAAVAASTSVISPGNSLAIDVLGPANWHYRIGITSPAGDWTFGEFTTDGNGDSSLTLNPWTDPGTWLITVDLGGGATDFGAAFDTFLQQ